MRVIYLQMVIRYMNKTHVFTDGTSRMALLHGKNRGAARHGVLRSAEKELAGLVPAFVSPHANADLLVHWSEIFSR